MNHIKSHDPISVIEYKCVKCDKVFNNSKKLKDHDRYDHGNENFHCHHCDFTTIKVNSLRAHVKTAHKQIAKFKCDHCT